MVFGSYGVGSAMIAQAQQFLGLDWTAHQAIAGYASAAVGLIGIVLLAWTLFETRRTAEAAVTSTEGFKNAERARVSIRNTKAGNFLPPGTNALIAFDFVNHGRSAAFLEGARFTPYVAKFLPEVPPLSDRAGAFQWVLSAGETKGYLEPLGLTEEQFKAWQVEKANIFVLGCVIYRDVFGQKHQEDFAVMFMPRGGENGMDTFRPVMMREYWRSRSGSEVEAL